MIAVWQCLVVGAFTVGAGTTQERVYQGTWKTTDRPMSGSVTCVITPVAKDRWTGRFSGKWQGADFDYKTDFRGPSSDLRGTATIDGVPYQWRGRIDSQGFQANFSGGYRGSFDLREVQPPLRSARQQDANRLSGR
jgi:hypothetical protein